MEQLSGKVSEWVTWQMRGSGLGERVALKENIWYRQIILAFSFPFRKERLSKYQERQVGNENLSGSRDLGRIKKQKPARCQITWLDCLRVLLWKSTRIVWEKQADEATERGGDTGRESRGFMNGASQVEPLGRGKSMMTNVWKRNVSLHSHEGPRKVPEQHALAEKRFEKKRNPKEKKNYKTFYSYNTE